MELFILLVRLAVVFFGFYVAYVYLGWLGVIGLFATMVITHFYGPFGFESENFSIWIGEKK